VIKMKKQFVVAVGILLTLGTAMAATMNSETRSTRAATIQSASQAGSKEAVQIVTMLQARVNSSALVPLVARPL
jgi:hypothetical protein